MQTQQRFLQTTSELNGKEREGMKSTLKLIKNISKLQL